MNKIDLSRYDNEHLKDFINRAWDIIFVLAHGYNEPLGSLHFDLTDTLNQYMIEASRILFKRENG